MPKLTIPNDAGSVDMKRMFNRPMTHFPVNNVYHEDSYTKFSRHVDPADKNYFTIMGRGGKPKVHKPTQAIGGFNLF